MSVRVMSYVWEHSQEREEGLLVLLALADFADDAGLCWPAVETIATKARITPRGATGVLTRLEKTGAIRRQIGRGRGNRSVYQVVLSENTNVVPVLYERLKLVNKTRRRTPKNPKEDAIKPEGGRISPNEPSGTIKEPLAETARKRAGTGLRSMGEILEEARRRAG